MNQSYFQGILSPAFDSLYFQNYQPNYGNGASHVPFTQNTLLQVRKETNETNSNRLIEVAKTNLHFAHHNQVDRIYETVKQADQLYKTIEHQPVTNAAPSNFASKSIQTKDDGKVQDGKKQKAKKTSYVYKPAERITYAEHQESIRNTPAFFLGLFLDLDVMNWLICEMTVNGRHSKNFTAPTEEELRCFIAVLYLSGYVDVPRRRMLWERSPDTHCPLVSNAMQRDRFESIFTALQSGDNLKDDVERLHRIRPLIDMLNVKFLRNCPPDDQHSIAENVIRSPSKHHNAKGPGKTLKVWCGCTKSGYCLYFTPSQTNDVALGRSIILHYARLVQHYKPAFCNLTFDSSYSEPSFVNALHKIGVQPAGVDREKTGCLLNPPLGGVDRLDCNLNLYRSTIKGRKFYSALLIFCLDLALNNAWQLYKSGTTDKRPLDLLGFRRNIVVYYLEHYAKPILGHRGGRPARLRPKGKRHLASDARYDGVRHYVVPQEKQTRCGKCAAKTTTRCQKCDVGVHVKCFVEFHTRPRVEHNVT